MQKLHSKAMIGKIAFDFAILLYLGKAIYKKPDMAASLFTKPHESEAFFLF
jgi:hypothetical protein